VEDEEAKALKFLAALDDLDEDALDTYRAVGRSCHGTVHKCAHL
jgi:hypothetical protein